MNLEISKTSTWVRFLDFYEDVIGVESPYVLERTETSDTIVWFGLSTNWRFYRDKWCVLERSEWVECEEPIYETLFKELKEKQNKIIEILKNGEDELQTS